MPLASIPRIDRLELGFVTRLPEWHPEHGHFEPFPVHAWLVHHPDGPILVDTGIGLHNKLINEFYAPTVVPIRDALTACDTDPDDIVAIVLSHLHFDHCGQQNALTAPVHVQTAEASAAKAHPHYTVDEWAHVDDSRLRLADGDTELAEGITLLLTPGHTPGHQSVAISSDNRRIVLGAQCAFRCAEVRSGEPSTTNLHDETWRDAARESLAHIRSLRPVTVELSHDPATLTLA